MPDRKIVVNMTPDTDPDNLDTPYSYCVLEWTKNHCLDGEGKILPGTEHGCWFNTGICGWMPTPEMAFASAIKQFNERFPEDNHEWDGFTND